MEHKNFLRKKINFVFIPASFKHHAVRNYTFYCVVEAQRNEIKKFV